MMFSKNVPKDRKKALAHNKLYETQNGKCSGIVTTPKSMPIPQPKQKSRHIDTMTLSIMHRLLLVKFDFNSISKVAKK